MMQFNIERRGIEIIPETAQDKAYIEDTLGLDADSPQMLLVRRAPVGMKGTLGWLETVPFDKDSVWLVVMAARDLLAESDKDASPNIGDCYERLRTALCALETKP